MIQLVNVGRFFYFQAPRRMKNDKWAVSEKEYPDKLYPNFVSGEARTQMFPTRKIAII